MLAPTRDARSQFETLVSLVLPVFNEAQVLERLTEALRQKMEDIGGSYEVIFVNDGSTDQTEAILEELADRHPEVAVVHLTRNFGHQAALHAGLSHASGDAIVVMDSDFQDDPGAISTFLDLWETGYDVIYAVRTKRKENAVKRGLFSAFYRVLNFIAETPIPKDAGNFGLIDRRVADDILKLSDTDRFFPGLRGWVGYRQLGVEVERLPRHDEQPRVSFWGLCRLAKTAIFSFSRVPLTLFYVIGLVSWLCCAGVISFALYKKWITYEAIPGWTSGLITASFFGAINSMGVAILGEYVVRIYDQVRARPQFLVDRTRNLGEENPKFESRNPKQTPMPPIPMLKT